MRTCTRCGIPAEESGFYKKAYGKNKVCKECIRKYDKKRRDEIRARELAFYPITNTEKNKFNTQQ